MYWTREGPFHVFLHSSNAAHPPIGVPAPGWKVSSWDSCLSSPGFLDTRSGTTQWETWCLGSAWASCSFLRVRSNGIPIIHTRSMGLGCVGRTSDMVRYYLTCFGYCFVEFFVKKPIFILLVFAVGLLERCLFSSLRGLCTGVHCSAEVRENCTCCGKDQSEPDKVNHAQHSPSLKLDRKH